MIIEKLKTIFIQAVKLLFALLLTFIGLILSAYPIVLQMDFSSEGVWGYLFIIPIGVTLLIITFKVIDWDKLIDFKTWDEIEPNNKKIRL